MPELPEVETVKNGFLQNLEQGLSVSNYWQSPYPLRFSEPDNIGKKLKRQSLKGISRRAKYLMFEFEDYILVSHLGMSGTWREGVRNQKHDHIQIEFSNGKVFTFHDPRRFGYICLLPKKDWQKHKFFSHLGPEPLGKDFSADYLYAKTRKKQQAIKNFIMDQKIVVGVGNIYASEALFLSGIRPSKRAFKLTRKQSQALVENIKVVLKKAIQAGGSYIRDFLNIEGAASFQRQLYVYGKAECECKHCGHRIKKIVQAGRSSFYCPQCQV